MILYECDVCRSVHTEAELKAGEIYQMQIQNYLPDKPQQYDLNRSHICDKCMARIAGAIYEQMRTIQKATQTKNIDKGD